MRSVHAISISPDALRWLANSRHPRILHVFDCACNLINEGAGVLSIVTPQAGDGPFNLVVEDEVCFSGQLDLTSRISVSTDRLWVGDLRINTTNVRQWRPRADWETLHARKHHIIQQLTKLPGMKERAPGLDSFCVETAALDFATDLQYLVSNFSFALVNAEAPSAVRIASQLAGLGDGLTPAGDDFLMGSIYAAWIIHPGEIAQALAQEIAETAAPRTTSLSAAWLRSAAKGEAGMLWHRLFQALTSSHAERVPPTIDKILSVGETSGADAWAGFLSTIQAATIFAP
jgi:hypothetical protein